jgi:chromosomal replication initiation ATPase DnaA
VSPWLKGMPTLDKANFAFDRFFGADATDDEVYAALGRPLVHRAMAGQVGVVFAYGQTGSGKTHTMGGAGAGAGAGAPTRAETRSR